MIDSRIGLEGTSVAVVRGGTGSGSVFSPAAKGSSARVEASDIRAEVKVDDRVEEG